MNWKKVIRTIVVFFLASFCLLIFINSVPFVSSTYYKGIPFLPFRIGRVLIGILSIAMYASLIKKLSFPILKQVCKIILVLVSLLIIAESIFTFLPIYTQDHYSPLSKNYLQQCWHENLDNVRDDEMIDYYNPEIPTILLIGDEFTLGLGLCDIKYRFTNIIRNKLSNCYNVVLIGRHNGNAKLAYEVVQSLPFHPMAVIYVHSPDDIVGNTGRKDEIPEIASNHNILNESSFLIDYLNESKNKTYLESFEQLKEYYSNKEFIGIHHNRIGGIIHYCQSFDYRLGVVTVPLIRNSDLLEYSDSVMVQPTLKFLSYNATPRLDLTPLVREIPEQKRTLATNRNYPSRRLHESIADSIIAFMVEKYMIDGKCVD